MKKKEFTTHFPPILRCLPSSNLPQGPAHGFEIRMSKWHQHPMSWSWGFLRYCRSSYQIATDVGPEAAHRQSTSARSSPDPSEARHRFEPESHAYLCESNLQRKQEVGESAFHACRHCSASVCVDTFFVPHSSVCLLAAQEAAKVVASKEGFQECAPWPHINWGRSESSVWVVHDIVSPESLRKLETQAKNALFFYCDGEIPILHTVHTSKATMSCCQLASGTTVTVKETNVSVSLFSV